MPELPINHDSTQPSLGTFFGQWSLDPGDSGRLNGKYETQTGKPVTVSFKVSPEKGIITELTIRSSPGGPVDSSGAEQELRLTNLSCDVTSIFIEKGINDVAEGVRFILREAPLEEIDYSPALWAKREKEIYPIKLPQEISRIKGLSAEVGVRAIHAIFESQNKPHVERFDWLAMHIENFSDGARAKVVSTLLQCCVEKDRTDLLFFATFGNKHTNLLNYVSKLSAEFGATLLQSIEQHGHSFHSEEPRVRKHVSNRNEVDDIASYFQKHSKLNVQYFEFPSCLHLFSERFRPQVVQLFVEVLLKKDDLQPVIFYLSRPGYARSESAREKYKQEAELLKGLPAEVAFKSIPPDTEHGFGAGGASYSNLLLMLRHINLFVDLDKELLLTRILSLDKLSSAVTDELSNVLANSKGFSMELAQCLIDRKQHKMLANNFASFNLTAPKLANIVDMFERDGKLQHVIEVIPSMNKQKLSWLEAHCFAESYLVDINLPSVELFRRYRELKAAGDDAGVLTLKREVKAITNALVSCKPIPDSISSSRYYRELVDHLYPDHSRPTTRSDSSNYLPLDRTAHMANFNFKPEYEIIINQGVEMVLKPEQFIDPEVKERLESSIHGAIEVLSQNNYDPKKLMEWIDQKLQKYQGISKKLSTVEQKITYLCVEANSGRVDIEDLKILLVAYQLATIENARGYLEGTRARSEQSKNPYYSYLLELNEYFSDKIPDAVQIIFNEARDNTALMDFCTKRFTRLIKEQKLKQRTQIINKFQLNKAGVSPAFSKKVAGILHSNMETDKKFNLVATLIQKERQKIASVMSEVTGNTTDPEEIHLGNFNIDSFLNDISEAKTEHSGDSVMDYLAYNSSMLYKEEVELVKRELSKFTPGESDQSLKPLKVQAVFSKNSAAAFARRVCGVCVDKDNPEEQYPDIPSQWNMPHYFQLVLYNQSSDRCEGLVLLHWYEDKGQKILTASLNPSSTFLYKVNEEELFKKLLSILGEFAVDNDFDYICCAKEGYIRTNRTGGEFESALTNQIKSTARSITLSERELFSFKPMYYQQELDVLWERGDK